MNTYISIRIVLIDYVETTFITETFDTVTIISRLDMIYSQHSSVIHNTLSQHSLDLCDIYWFCFMICLHNI